MNSGVPLEVSNLCLGSKSLDDETNDALDHFHAYKSLYSRVSNISCASHGTLVIAISRFALHCALSDEMGA